MRSLYTVAVILGLTAIGDAQNGSVQVQTMPPSRAMSFTAQSFDRVGEMLHFEGAVKIEVGGVQISADSADTRPNSRRVELHGNVTVLPLEQAIGIVTGGVQITADGADTQPNSRRVELHGNVSVLLPPAR